MTLKVSSTAPAWRSSTESTPQGRVAYTMRPPSASVTPMHHVLEERVHSCVSPVLPVRRTQREPRAPGTVSHVSFQEAPLPSRPAASESTDGSGGGAVATGSTGGVVDVLPPPPRYRHSPPGPRRARQRRAGRPARRSRARLGPPGEPVDLGVEAKPLDAQGAAVDGCEEHGRRLHVVARNEPVCPRLPCDV